MSRTEAGNNCTNSQQSQDKRLRSLYTRAAGSMASRVDEARPCRARKQPGAEAALMTPYMTPHKWRHTDGPYKWRHTDGPYKWRHTDGPYKWRHTDGPYSCVLRQAAWCGSRPDGATVTQRRDMAAGDRNAELSNANESFADHRERFRAATWPRLTAAPHGRHRACRIAGSQRSKARAASDYLPPESESAGGR
jgi:hypothetical protein